MGMSASQARLLALLARQSNLEYQGQQINQARSVLSQQCTALYNSLLDMTVPTPPVTTDFQTIQYKGTKGASKFSIGTVTPKSDGTYNVEMKYSKNGNCLKGGTQLPVTTYNEPQFITGKFITDNEEFNTPVTTTRYLNPADDGNGDGEINATEVTNGVTSGGTKLTDDTKVMHSVNFPDENYKGKYYYKDTTTGRFVETESFDDAKNAKNGDGNVFKATTLGDIKDYFDDKGVYDGVTLDYLYEGNPDNPQVETTGGFTIDRFQTAKFYDAEGKLITSADLEQKGTRDGVPIYDFKDDVKKKGKILMYQEGGSDEIKNPKYDPDAAAKGTSIGEYPPQAFSEDVLKDSYKSALQAVANTYPEYRNAEGQPDAGKIADSFKVFFKPNTAGELIPYFVKTSELNQTSEMSSNNRQSQIAIYSLEPNGSYTESVPTDGVKLYFDGNGRITSMDIPVGDDNGNITYETVSLEMETVVDEDAYKDAMAKYDYEQYLYDQKQKEINAKTEIIQQEDRNLELKLQRLDNERTQITTEIEAVEKVIKENTEKSYKTFNG